MQRPHQEIRGCCTSACYLLGRSKLQPIDATVTGSLLQVGHVLSTDGIPHLQCTTAAVVTWHKGFLMESLVDETVLVAYQQLSSCLPLHVFRHMACGTHVGGRLDSFPITSRWVPSSRVSARARENNILRRDCVEQGWGQRISTDGRVQGLHCTGSAFCLRKGTHRGMKFHEELPPSLVLNDTL